MKLKGLPLLIQIIQAPIERSVFRRPNLRGFILRHITNGYRWWGWGHTKYIISIISIQHCGPFLLRTTSYKKPWQILFSNNFQVQYGVFVILVNYVTTFRHSLARVSVFRLLAQKKQVLLIKTVKMESKTVALEKV